MRVKIGIQGDNDSFVITPLDFSTTDIRGLEVYIKYLNGGYVDGNRVIVPLSNADVLDIYHKTVQLFEQRFKCQIENDADAGSLLGSAVSEEERFRAFSAKAYAIRNNDIEGSELTAFLDCVKHESFIRTLKPFKFYPHIISHLLATHAISLFLVQAKLPRSWRHMLI